MRKIKLNLFPGGVRRAVTFSYDDGMEYDYRLVEIMNRNGIKGTFHLNSGTLGKAGYVKTEDVASLYAGHEVSSHMVTHPFPTQIPDAIMIKEIMEDRQALESQCGYPVRGMSYPFGDYAEHVINVAECCGMEYARTVEATKSFGIPQNFMKWNPTAHHDDDIFSLWKRFIERNFSEQLLFYLWGHSFEFDRKDNWDRIEEFCKLVGNREDIWYATNIEIMDYIKASRNLKFSSDCSMVYNPSGTDIWISVDGRPVCVKAASLTRLEEV